LLVCIFQLINHVFVIFFSALTCRALRGFAAGTADRRAEQKQGIFL
jgi:hypothetical protein